MGAVTPEVRKEFSVFVYPQELTDDLDCEEFRVEECGSGVALSERPEVCDRVVYEAEDG